MNWTAKITNKELIDNDRVRVVIQLTNGVETLDKAFELKVGSLESLKSLIRDEITRIDNLKTFDTDIKIGDFNLDPIIPTPEPEPIPAPPPVPTPEELKKKEYQEKVNEFGEKKQFVDLGIIPDSDLDPLREEIKLLAQDLGLI